MASTVNHVVSSLSASPLEAHDPRFPREFTFLLTATAIARGNDPRALADLADPQLDWTTIVPGIARHGMLWLAPALLKASGLMPAPAATALRAAQAHQAIASLRLIDEAVRVARALAAADIRFLMIKGAPLSVQLHGDPARRPGRDIDVVVERGKAVEAGAVLAGMGYTLIAGDVAAPSHDGPLAKETGYINRAKRIMVEVHDRLTDNALLLPWDFETLWAERETVRIGGVDIPTMARHRLPLYLCVHGAKHCWARLIWLDDLASALDNPAAIDRALADADAHGLRATILHALSVLHRWIAHPVAPTILAEAQASRHVALLNAIVARFHADPLWYQQPRPDSWRRFRQGSIQERAFTYAMKTRWSYWRRQLVHELSSSADRQMVKLPDRLDWLYPAIRPFGWIVRRVRGR